MCHSCLKNLTKDEVVKYRNMEFCEDCLRVVYETQPKLMAVYLAEDAIEECFFEFA